MHICNSPNRKKMYTLTIFSPAGKPLLSYLASLPALVQKAHSCSVGLPTYTSVFRQLKKQGIYAAPVQVTTTKEQGIAVITPNSQGGV